METKRPAGMRPVRSIARYERPRIVVAPRTYMDVIAPVVQRPVQPAPKPAQSTKLVVSNAELKPSKYFDVKPAAPSQSVSRIAPVVEPISKEPIVAPPAPLPEEAPESEPAADVVQLQETQQSDDQVKTEAPKKKRLFRKPSKQKSLYGMAVLLFIFGAYVSVDGWLANRAVLQQASVLGAQTDKSDQASGAEQDDRHPAEGKPPSVKGYKVSPELPRLIKIPSLKVSARVVPLGVKKDNSLAAPSNIFDAGWYTASSRPTDRAGAMLIDGHVSGPTQKGVFYGIKNLKADDEIVVERGDGQTLTFGVQHVETVKAEDVDMMKLLNSADPTKLGLNLITCGGAFDAKSSEFKSRVLVFAVQK